MTGWPFSFTQSLSPLSLIKKVFHSPMGRSAFVLGVTPARTAGLTDESGTVAPNLSRANTPTPDVHLRLMLPAQEHPRIHVWNLRQLLFTSRIFPIRSIGENDFRRLICIRRLFDPPIDQQLKVLEILDGP